MILGVDPGYAKCGWSIVDPKTGRVRALGVILTEKIAKEQKLSLATDRARRMVIVCERLAEIAAAHDVTVIVAEEPLGFGASAAVAANQLPWGAIVMLATLRGYGLVGVAAKTWQRAVLGDDVKKVDYERIEKALASYITGQAIADFDEVAPHLRNHALDACGIGMLAALRPHMTTPIAARRLHVERKDATT